MSKVTPAAKQPSDQQHSRSHHLIANQWKPGQSGNPSGKPKGLPSISHLLQLYAGQITDKRGPDGKPMTWAARIALATLKLAEKGHPQALREVYERIDGKVAEKIDIHFEGQLWQRLNAGRMRIAHLVQDKLADGTVHTEASTITFDASATSDQQLTELDNAEHVSITTDTDSK